MVGFSMVLAFFGFIVVGAITNMQGRAVPIIGFSILAVMVPAGLIFLNRSGAWPLSALWTAVL